MKEKIESIRKRFEAILTTNPTAATDLYHPIDIERVRTEEWQIKRYLLDCGGDEEQAFRHLLATLEWKKSYNVHDMTPEDFPAEFYPLYRVEQYGEDHAGRVVRWESFRAQHSDPVLDETFRKMVAITLEHIDRVGGERGLTYVADFTNTSALALDLRLSHYRVDLINRHYPYTFKQLILLNVPMMAKPVIKLVVNFMKPSIRDVIQYVGTKDLPTLIDPQYIPEELMGKRKVRNYPKNCQPFRQCCHRFGCDEKFVDRFLSQPLVQEMLE